MKSIAPATPSVLSHVRQLVVVILLITIAVIGLILWQVYEHNKTNDIALNYHAASSEFIGTTANELLLIKNYLHVFANQNIVPVHRADHTKLIHEVNKSLYVIKQKASQIYFVQDQYQISNFSILVNQLQIHLEPLLSIMDPSVWTNVADSETHLSNVDAVLLTLKQLERLHKITVKEFVKKSAAQERSRTLIILIMLLGTLLFGGFITKNAFGSIKTILKDQKITEENLIQEKELIHTTLNSIGDAVITTNNTGQVTSLNPVAEQLTGWTSVEARGRSVKSIFPIVHASTHEPIENPVEKVLTTGATVYLSNHTTLIAKNGTEYQIADSAAPIRNEDGHILGMVLVFNDVTEQYQLRHAAAKSKRDLQAIMDNSPAVIYVKDTAGRFTFVNQQFEKVFNIPSNVVIGKTLHDIFPKEFADQMKHNDNKVLAAGRAIESEEVAPHDDGLHSYISIKFPLFNGTEQAYAVCGISTDITERKKQEEQLHHSQKMDALGKLTGGIAHDYNNLLGIIMGYAEQLRSHLDRDFKFAKYAHDIYHAAERGTKLTKKLLTYSQRKAHDAEVLDVNALLQDQQLMLEKTLTARIKLVLTLAADLWPVCVDSSELANAIINLCINAMHAMDAGGELTIRTSNEQVSNMDAKTFQLKAGDYVLLSVTDTGCGMDAITKERIFDPFYSTKGEQGTGLGLSQVYGFVEHCGGVIKVYSEPGHGSRFALYFPRSHDLVAEAGTPATEAVHSLHGSETLLIVDDEQALVELTRDVFTEHGYRVITANNGAQALAKLERESVDLLISDVIMPNMDGYQLAALVKERYPHIQIQMTSGYADDRHNGMVNSALHDNILYKPYSLKSLLERVRGLLEMQNATTLAGRTIMVMDDDEEVRELFSINLAKLHCKTIAARDGEQAITFYRKSLENGDSIDAVIMDLSMPGGIGGKDVADKISAMDPHAIMIVASGHSYGPEMTHYRDYGFHGALEKNFDRDNIKQVLEQALSSSKQ